MMVNAPMTRFARSSEPRRTLYLRSKRLLVGLAARRSPGRRAALESAARRFLRGRSRSYLVRVIGNRGFALAAAATIMAALGSTTASALPPVELADVAAGTGGFVINGIDPGGNSNAGESYVVFGTAMPPCPWDCADGDGDVGIVDFLALLANWGPCP